MLYRYTGISYLRFVATPTAMWFFYHTTRLVAGYSRLTYVCKTHHFTVDFVEMNFTDFVYYIFRVERHETETWNEKNKNND